MSRIVLEGAAGPNARQSRDIMKMIPLQTMSKHEFQHNARVAHKQGKTLQNMMPNIPFPTKHGTVLQFSPNKTMNLTKHWYTGICTATCPFPARSLWNCGSATSEL